MKKKHLINFLTALMALLSMSIYANAQSSPKAADMSIDSVAVTEIPGKYVVEIVVRSGDNDSDTGGEDVELRIVVPFPAVYIGFNGDASSCIVVSNQNAVGDAYVTCDLDNMDLNSTKTIYISTSRNIFYSLKVFSAFVTNTFPDPHPENNFGCGEPDEKEKHL